MADVNHVLDAERAHRNDVVAAGLPPYVANLLEILRNLRVTTFVISILWI